MKETNILTHVLYIISGGIGLHGLNILEVFNSWVSCRCITRRANLSGFLENESEVKASKYPYSL